MNIQKVINGLSDAQKACIMYSRYNSLGDNYYVEVDEINRLSTINALIRKGLIHTNKTGFRYFITEDAEAIREQLNK